MQHQHRIVLSAGEECLVTGSAAVHVTLLTGVFDIAGVSLEANRVYTFYLSVVHPTLSVYTLEGGTGVVDSNATIEVHKTELRVAPLLQLARRTLVQLSRSRVVVIGQRGVGKTLAAHTLCNTLLRLRSDGDVAASCEVLAMDLNTESNCLYAPGCVTVVPLREPPALWPGVTASPTRLPLSLFTGAAQQPSARSLRLFLYFCEQLSDMASGLVDELCGRAGVPHHVIVDAPTPLPGLSESVFYKKLIELLRPTHVVIVGARDDADGVGGGGGGGVASSTWSTFLQEDVQRILPECEFVLTPTLAPVSALAARATAATATTTDAAASPTRSRRLREYFVGSVFEPLACCKVVVSTQAMQFVELCSRDDGAAGEDVRDGNDVLVRKCHVDKSCTALVCALSHAELLEEVPLAPVAGMLVIVDVDVMHDEVVMLVPAAETTTPRRYVVVPRASDRATLQLTRAELTALEDSVAY